MNPQDDIQKVLSERFAVLPKVVRDAITSADIEKHLRELADTHKLHLDQWSALENEVMLALLGIQRTEDLAQHIKTEVGLDDDAAHALATDISRVVFDPVRKELERELEHPDAVAVATTGVEDMRTRELAKAEDQSGPKPEQGFPLLSANPIAPGTPPAPAPEGTVERAAVSPAYAPAEPSHERKTIAGDPYREQLQ